PCRCWRCGSCVWSGRWLKKNGVDHGAAVAADFRATAVRAGDGPGGDSGGGQRRPAPHRRGPDLPLEKNHRPLPAAPRTARLRKGYSLSSLAERLVCFHADARRVAALMEKIARAVQYMHEKGVLHRDLNPSNALLDENGEPLVSDFGVAKLRDAD